MTSPPPLPGAGRERAIFVQALREFSTACQAPSLMPSCPFFRIGDSGPWCLEECMDLLAQHHDGSLEGMEILEDLRVIRIPRRARRGIVSSAKPFDAAEIHLADGQRALSEWRPSALLRDLRDQSGPPLGIDPQDAAARMSRVTLLLERFAELGIDGERLFRSIYGSGMAHAIVTMSAMPLLLGAQAGLAELPAELSDVIDGWPELLLGEQLTPQEWFAIANEHGDAWAQDRVRQIFLGSRRVAQWLESLPLAELLVWRAPTQGEFELLGDGPSSEPNPEDRWIFDRFMETYLDGWDYQSLLLEWRYLHGSLVAPCGVEAMRTRHVRPEDLANAIALKSSRDDGTKGSKSMTVASFVRPAISHLREGRFAAAAAIFDACRIAAPADADAHNNYGFCMLPLDPAAALDALERAAELGMRLEPLNAANRMVALHRLGRFSTALEVASRVAASTAWTRTPSGFLWSWDADTWKLVDVVDARAYIADFALAISVEADDRPAARTWSARIRDLSDGVDGSK